MRRPRILDLYCGPGGAGAGYARAGLDVVGVDLHHQPNNPYACFQWDALDWLRNDGASGFDAIHASPPCQAYSKLRSLSDNEHPDLLAPTRELLIATGLPYVIENVPGAPMRRDYVLCGSAFGLGAKCRDGRTRQLRRHRWFETNWPPGLVHPCHHVGEPIGVYGTGGRQQKTVWSDGVNRGYMGDLAECRRAMGIDWMTKAEISQAIPPAYTELIGAHLLDHLSHAARSRTIIGTD